MASPWTVLAQGIRLRTGLSSGWATLAVIVAALLLSVEMWGTG